MKYGNELRNIRKDRDLKQKDIAKHLPLNSYK